MNLRTITDNAINPALALLPQAMDSKEARIMLLAIGLQESRFEYRRQLGDGPARGFWQFERGTAASKGGVWGVFLHPATNRLLRDIAGKRGCPASPSNIWERIEHDDVLAAALARLLLFTDPLRLPAVGDVDGAWALYAKRCWRPGRPHPQTWAKFHAQAVAEVLK